MTYYDYKRFCADVQNLTELCKPFEADTIIAVARGGMTLAHALAMSLNIRNVQSIRVESYDGSNQRDAVSVSGRCDFLHSKRILVVDDIVDSGRTLSVLMPILHSENRDCEFKTVSLFTKSSALIQPDLFLHEATDWIDFFWERDFLKSNLL